MKFKKKIIFFITFIILLVVAYFLSINETNMISRKTDTISTEIITENYIEHSDDVIENYSNHLKDFLSDKYEVGKLFIDVENEKIILNISNNLTKKDIFFISSAIESYTISFDIYKKNQNEFQVELNYNDNQLEKFNITKKTPK